MSRYTQKHKNMESYAFSKGWRKANADQKERIMKQLKEALGGVTEQAVYARMRGEVEPKVSQAAAIEKIFAREKIRDIWGLKPKKVK